MTWDGFEIKIYDSGWGWRSKSMTRGRAGYQNIRLRVTLEIKIYDLGWVGDQNT